MRSGTPSGFLKKAGSRCAALAMCVAVLALTACGSDDGTAKPDPKKASNALAAGLDAQAKGNLDEAVNQYNEVLKYDKKNKYALYDLALIDAARSNYGEAENKYRVVLAIDPAFEPALFNLAILVKAKGNSTEAISLYQRAIKAAPKDAAAHLNLGLLLRAMGDTAQGNAEVKKAIALNPKLKDPAASASTPPKSPVASESASPDASSSPS
ncbi:MAG: tetratricopeptide repeat protein [Jatrophihabitantaceae bacterium]